MKAYLDGCYPAGLTLLLPPTSFINLSRIKRKVKLPEAGVVRTDIDRILIPNCSVTKYILLYYFFKCHNCNIKRYFIDLWVHEYAVG